MERSIQTKTEAKPPEVATKHDDEIALLEALWTRTASPRSGGSRFLEGHAVGIDLGTTSDDGSSHIRIQAHSATGEHAAFLRRVNIISRVNVVTSVL